jgi:hypothetical protein
MVHINNQYQKYHQIQCILFHSNFFVYLLAGLIENYTFTIRKTSFKSVVMDLYIVY